MNIWRLNWFLLKFFWEVGACQNKKVKVSVTQKYLFSVDSFTRKGKLFFDETFWYVNDKPCISKKKLSYLKWNDAPCFFSSVKHGSKSQLCEPPYIKIYWGLFHVCPMILEIFKLQKIISTWTDILQLQLILWSFVCSVFCSMITIYDYVFFHPYFRWSK